MKRLRAIMLLILLAGLSATILEIGSSGELLKVLGYATIDAFKRLEDHGVPIELVVFVLMLLESAGFRIPSEIVMPLGGFLASLGFCSFRGVVLAGTLGNVAGSLIAYYIGYHGLHRFMHRRFGSLMESINRRGDVVTLITRLTPGVRTYAPFVLGASKVRFRPFIVYTLIGSFIRLLPFAYLGYVFGSEREIIVEKIHRYTPMILAALIDALLYAIYREKSRAGKG